MHSEKIDQIADALRQLQMKIYAVGKNKSGYNNAYTYADLAKVIEFSYPTMTELGLSVTQSPDSVGDTPALTTMLMHTSGQWISGTYPIGNAGMKSAVNTAQQFGAAISYARRYALLAILGIAAADDDAHCLGAVPEDIKKTAESLDMSVEEPFPNTMDKDGCLDLIEHAVSIDHMKKVCGEHKERAKAEGWIDEMTTIFAARSKEMSK